jgi:signal transduction histidine kinase
MIEQLLELRQNISQDGLKEALDDMTLESSVSKLNIRFFRLFSPDGKVLYESLMSPWKNMNVNSDLLKKASWEAPLFETVKIPQTEKKGRIIYVELDSKLKLQMGYSLDKEKGFLKSLQQTFWRIFFLLAFPASMIIGGLLAVRAMREIKKMTYIVSKVRDGDLSIRMPVKRMPNEMTSLAMAFNEMLDKLQLLLKECKYSADSIAHDLRSPLTRICGAMEIAVNNERSKEEYVSAIQNAVEQIKGLREMINVLLDISSMESNVLEDRKKIKLKIFLEEVIDIFQYAADERSIHIELECNNDAEVALSPIFMKRAIANLIDNAIKYTGKGGVVGIKAEITEKQLNLCVSDTGVGIAMSDIGRVFERFFRSESSRTTSGFGLGLSLVKAVVDSHGGRISVKSKLHGGTTFVISLPV